MNEPLLYDHARAILDRLGDAHDDIAVGDGAAPRGADKKTIVHPSVVFYLRAGGLLSGTLQDPEDDGWLPFKLTCIGESAKQARWVADKVHVALKSEPLEVEGRRIARLERTFLGANADRDTDVKPPLFHLPAEYRLWSFAAAPVGS